MAGVNKVMFIGNLGKDPELRWTDTGKSVCNFSIAVNEKWKDAGGNVQESVEWVKVAAWGKLAELCNEYLQKGKQVYVEGKLKTRKWTDKDGIDRWTPEVQAREVVFIGKGSDGSGDRMPDGPDYTDDEAPPEW